MHFTRVGFAVFKPMIRIATNTWYTYIYTYNAIALLFDANTRNNDIYYSKRIRIVPGDESTIRREYE